MRRAIHQAMAAALGTVMVAASFPATQAVLPTGYTADRVLAASVKSSGAPTWSVCSPRKGTLKQPESLALDAQGNMYAGNVDMAKERSWVAKLSPACARLSLWTKGIGNVSPEPYGAVVNPQGNVDVTGEGAVLEYSPTGKPLRKRGLAGTGLAVDLQGNLYTADYESPLARLSPSGATTELGPEDDSSGSGPGQFNFVDYSAIGLAVDAAGNIYVADTGNNRIQKLSPSGAPLAQWGTAGAGPGQLYQPQGLALDEHGNIFVADTGNDRIEELSPTGQFVAQWGHAGVGAGELLGPIGLAFDRQGNLYVADSQNNRIQKLSLGKDASPTGTPGFTQPPPARDNWRASVFAMRSLASLHSTGTFRTAPGASVDTVTSDCGLDQWSFVLQGQGATVEVIVTGNGAVSRSREGSGPWSSWQTLPSDAGFGLGELYPYACPQLLLRLAASGFTQSLPNKKIRSETLAGAAVWHLHSKSKSGKDSTVEDFYIDKATHYWLHAIYVYKGRLNQKWDMRYSAFNEPMNIQLPQPLASASRRAVPAAGSRSLISRGMRSTTGWLAPFFDTNQARAEGLIDRSLGVSERCAGAHSVPRIQAAGGSWHSTGSMHVARAAHTATALLDGRVLVAGGETGSAHNATLSRTVEIYDPQTGRWQRTGSVGTARTGDTATLMADGRVLVAGGSNGTTALRTAELFDPATGRWHRTGNMLQPRAGHVAALLKDGRVLVAGGVGRSGFLRTAEIYNPHLGIWTPTGRMSIPRVGSLAVIMGDGKILVAGGTDGHHYALSSAEIFDPTSGKWYATGRMTVGRTEPLSGTILPSGSVLVVGGVFQPASRTAEIYDPATGHWRRTGSLKGLPFVQTTTLIPGGRVLVTAEVPVRGGAAAVSEIYDVAKGVWQMGPTMNALRSFQTATLLPNGRVLVAGGIGSGGKLLKSAEIYP